MHDKLRFIQNYNYAILLCVSLRIPICPQNTHKEIIYPNFMSSYKTLSILQSLAIFICGLSVFDYGYGSANLDDGIGFNKLLFDNSDSDFWNLIVFWGYCMIVVGILQLVKSISSD